MQLIDRIVLRVSELPDRTSPDDWPEAMLVTELELRVIVAEELRRDRIAALTPQRWRCRAGHGEFTRATAAQRRGLLECPLCLNVGYVGQLEPILPADDATPPGSQEHVTFADDEDGPRVADGSLVAAILVLGLFSSTLIFIGGWTVWGWLRG